MRVDAFVACALVDILTLVSMYFCLSFPSKWLFGPAAWPPSVSKGGVVWGYSGQQSQGSELYERLLIVPKNLQLHIFNY